MGHSREREHATTEKLLRDEKEKAKCGHNDEEQRACTTAKTIQN